ncbi:MAG TPA: hypothetical protein VII70_05275 [Steroidobacteraceae bacterium]
MSPIQPKNNPLQRFSADIPRAKVIGVGIVFLWFLLGGIAHFALQDLEVHLVPPYIAWPRAAVQVSGVFELLGALGLLYPATRRQAGWGLFALTVAVTPVHIYMLQHPEFFSVPYWALVLRLPLQAALLALILWSTAGAVRKEATPRQ